jgi:hypothetical protein
MGSARMAAPPSQSVQRTESGGMVVHGVEHTSRRGAARETETLLGFKRRRFKQEGNGRSSIETEGALREGMFLKASFPTSAALADPHSILDRVGPQFGEKNRSSERSRVQRKFAFRPDIRRWC